jgi:hypothetical protein
MKCRFIFAVITVLLLSKTGIRAQQDSSESSADVAFWVAYRGRPRVALFGPPEKAFNKNVAEIRAFRRTRSCWRWDGGSCIGFVPKEATKAGLRAGSSAFLTLQIEVDSPDEQGLWYSG